MFKCLAINGGWICTSDSGYVAVVVDAIPPTPTLAANPNPACTGGDINLTTPTVGGATYTSVWSRTILIRIHGDPVISNVQFSNAGSYSVTVTDGACTSLPGTVFVSISQTPNPPGASSNTPLCEGRNTSIAICFGIWWNVYMVWPSWIYIMTDQNATRSGVVVADSGDYCVFVTANNCPRVF